MYTTSAAPFNRIIDGVVDFRVRAYTGTGTNNFIPGPGVLITNVFTNASFLTTNIYAAPYFAPSQAAGEYQYEFFGNAVPGYVEVELGVLEPRTLERFRALTNTGRRGRLSPQSRRTGPRVPAALPDPER